MRLLLLLCAFTLLLTPAPASAQDSSETREEWSVAPDFDSYGILTIAVMPMDNFSLEPELERTLYDTVFRQLEKRGYSKVSAATVNKVMTELGIKTPGQLSAIKPDKLKILLKADALLYGQVDQSAAIHAGSYDALVVSCSLRLVDARSGKTIWKADQWRTAKRQWQLDPLNMLLNLAVHEKGSRKDRIVALAEHMLKTLPHGGIQVDHSNLLDQADEINAK